MGISKERLSGFAVPIVGDDIDTDRIVPARFLKEITFENMGKYLFHDVRYDENGAKKQHILNEVRYSKASIMIVNKNFGCGSSREHAPQAILRAGFSVILGESYSEIFLGNCMAIGIVAVTMAEKDIADLQRQIESDPSVTVSVNLLEKRVELNQSAYEIRISEPRRQAFLNGTWDTLTVLKKNQHLIEAMDKQLPY